MARKKVDPEIMKLWEEYKAKGGEERRNRLMEHYLRLVKYVAERLLLKLPSNVELDDLRSAGVFGLMDAIDNFDLSRGVKFETYCTARIRGAILDELRSMDWVPRLVRTRAGKLDKAIKKLQVELGREPTDFELADLMDMTLEEFDALVEEASATTMVSLSRQYGGGDDDGRSFRKIDVLEDRKVPDPVDKLHKKDLMDFISRGLSRKERLVLLLYYYEDLTMREIGHALDLSESRVCQIHSRIVMRLQAQLDKLRGNLM